MFEIENNLREALVHNKDFSAWLLEHPQFKGCTGKNQDLPNINAFNQWVWACCYNRDEPKENRGKPNSSCLIQARIMVFIPILQSLVEHLNNGLNSSYCDWEYKYIHEFKGGYGSNNQRDGVTKAADKLRHVMSKYINKYNRIVFPDIQQAESVSLGYKRLQWFNFRRCAPGDENKTTKDNDKGDNANEGADVDMKHNNVESENKSNEGKKSQDTEIALDNESDNNESDNNEQLTPKNNESDNNESESDESDKNKNTNQKKSKKKSRKETKNNLEKSDVSEESESDESDVSKESSSNDKSNTNTEPLPMSFSANTNTNTNTNTEPRYNLRPKKTNTKKKATKEFGKRTPKALRNLKRVPRYRKPKKAKASLRSSVLPCLGRAPSKIQRRLLKLAQKQKKIKKNRTKYFD